MRTFVAIDFPPETKMKIDEITTFLKKQTPNKALKWVKSNDLHLTVKFIGDITHRQLDQVKHIMSEVVADQTQFDITIEGLGMYPHKKEPRVIWLGISGGDPLVKIHRQLEQALKTADIEPDRRDYSPHLTIARVHKRVGRDIKRNIGDSLAQFKVDTLGTVNINKIVLYQSKLTPEGPIYTPLDTVPLNNV